MKSVTGKKESVEESLMQNENDLNNTGAPQKYFLKNSLIIFSVLAAVVFAVWASSVLRGDQRWRPEINKKSSTSSQKADALTPAQRTELQAMRNSACNTMRRLTDAGAFTKVEAGAAGVTHAYADRDFFLVPVDAKETALKAVALCYVDLDKKQQIGLVIIHDGYSGKKIGTYDLNFGLRLD